MKKKNVTVPPKKGFIHRLFSKNNHPYLIILILCFILYGNTLNNQYTLDDNIVILQNQFTKRGFRGIPDLFKYDTFTGFFGVEKNLVEGGRYRPFSLVTFAIEYQLYGENPYVSHLVNLLLYALTCMILFSILKLLLQKYDSNRKWYLNLSFIATLLFVAHPIHTEVIANIKGRDEILSLLGSLLALFFTLRYLTTKRLKFIALSFALFFVALLSKENAITFLAIIPLSLYFFGNFGFKKCLKAISPLLLGTIIFLVIRQNVLGPNSMQTAKELMNNPFLEASSLERIATVLYTWLLYLKLLVFPHPLTFDYYPKQIPIISFSDIRAIISLVTIIALLIIALIGIKKKRLISFGLLFFAITFSIVSNLFINIGVLMSERFVYASSIGFCIILGYGLISLMGYLFKQESKYVSRFTTLIILILGLYTVKTITRNSVWKNDYILFSNDVKISANSAKSNCSAGGIIMEEALKIRTMSENSPNFLSLKQNIENNTFLSESEQEDILGSGNLGAAKEKIKTIEQEMLKQSLAYLEKAVNIHPTYSQAILLRGNAYFEYQRDVGKSVEDYFKLLNANPENKLVYSNLTYVLKDYENVDFKIETWKKVLKINPDSFEANFQLGTIYGKTKNDYEEAIPFLEKATKLQPNNVNAFKNLGIVYAQTKRYESSIKASERAIQLNPNDIQTLNNIGITYRIMGNETKAQEYFARAEKLKSNSFQSKS